MPAALRPTGALRTWSPRPPAACKPRRRQEYTLNAKLCMAKPGPEADGRLPTDVFREQQAALHKLTEYRASGVANTQEREFARPTHLPISQHRA